MINLEDLLARINEHYSLELTASVESKVLQQLKDMGVSKTIDPNEMSQVSDTVDKVFSLVNHRPSEASVSLHEAAVLSGGPKLVVDAHGGKPCPRCKGLMGSAQLHTREMVKYCRKCKIALS